MSRRVVAKPAAVQSRPPSTEEAFAVGPLIGRVRTVLLTALDRELQPYGLAGTQFAVLKNIADQTADTAADLCRILHYDTGSMTRIVDRLEEKGLISRERSRDDRRVVSLRVTTAGRALLPRLRDTAARIVEGMLEGFSAGEVEELQRYLGRMIENGQRRVQAE